MDALPAVTPRRPRLNPFAFPSDTSLRFFILILFLLAASIQCWASIAFTFRPWQPPVGQNAVPGPNGELHNSPGAWYGAGQEIAPFYLEMMLLGVAALFLSTYSIYRCYPLLTVRRLRLTRFTSSQAPEVSDALVRLCTIAGLRLQPEFWWNPLDRRGFALAFGAGRRIRIGFAGSIALLAYTDQSAFRAIVLHELAHIRNGDIRRTYLSTAALWGFMVSALIPGVVVSLIKTTGLAVVMALVFAAVQIVIVGGIALALRNSVLRARELYADARSFAWLSNETALQQALDHLRKVTGLRRFASSHPDPHLRRRLAEETEEMFRFSPWDALGIGAVASYSSLMVYQVASMALLLLPVEFYRIESGDIDKVTASLNRISAVLFAGTVVPVALVLPMAIGATAVVVWRDTFRRVAGYGGPLRMMRVAVALSVGLLLGGSIPYAAGSLSFLWMTYGHGQMPPVSLPVLITATLAVSGALTVLLAIALLVFLKWIAAGATTWLPVVLTRRGPGAAFWSGAILAYFLSAIWVSLLPLVFMGDFATWLVLEHHEQLGIFAVFWAFVSRCAAFPTSVLTWSTLIAVWAFPLSAGLFSSGGTLDTAARWAVFEPDSGIIRFRPKPMFLRRALLIGLGVGSLTVIMLLWLNGPLGDGSLHDLILPPRRSFIPMFVYVSENGTTASLCVLIQGAVAVATVLAIPSLSIVHAMFAAFVAGSALAFGEIMLAILDGTASSIGGLMYMVAAPTTIGGALVAMACAVCTLAVKRSGQAISARFASEPIRTMRSG
jgi:Zn-dependent protease with chaperone function